MAEKSGGENLDWTPQLLAWGEHRQWRPLPPRALRKFREFSGIATATGVAADKALAREYAALAGATPAQRAAVTCRGDIKRLHGGAA